MSAYRRKDAFYARAKAQGLRSRAAFKLEELQREYRLLKPGDRVVDLGAWPGGWLQVSARLVGQRGRVVGVDVEPIPPLANCPQVESLQADIESPEVVALVAEKLGGRADVVLCDVAPKLTGIQDRDQAQARGLAERAIELAQLWLRPGGTLLIKLFMGGETQEIVSRLRKLFARVDVTRPDATRRGSSEMYAIARGFRGT